MHEFLVLSLSESSSVLSANFTIFDPPFLYSDQHLLAFFIWSSTYRSKFSPFYHLLLFFDIGVPQRLLAFVLDLLVFRHSRVRELCHSSLSPSCPFNVHLVAEVSNPSPPFLNKRSLNYCTLLTVSLPSVFYMCYKFSPLSIPFFRRESWVVGGGRVRVPPLAEVAVSCVS